MRERDVEDIWTKLERFPQFMEMFNGYNASLGNALVQLKRQKHDIQGRDVESALLTGILERPVTPVAALIGQAGVGKSALVEDFIKKVNDNRLQSVPGRKYFVVSLRIGYLKALGNNKLQSALTGLLDDLHKFELLAQKLLNDDKIKIVLFIDEFHMLVTIFGPGTKVGGDLMKDVLARTPIRVIAATTRKEFDSTIAVDEPFKERFKEIQLNELPKPVVMLILKNWWKSYNGGTLMPSDAILEKIIDANAAFRPGSAEPRKSLDILEDLVSYTKRFNKRITEDVVNDIFRNRFSINLTFDFDADAIFENIKKRVKGQALALYETHKALRAVAFKLDTNINQPIMRLLLTGATGVGKSVGTQDFTATTEGFKKNGDIKVGDYLFDRYGKPTRVLGVFPQGEREMYEISFTDGRSMVADGDHLFSYYTNYNQDELQTLTVKELLNSGLIDDGQYKYYIPANEPVQYPEKSYDIKPYDFGLNLTDNVIPDEYKIGSVQQRSDLLLGLYNNKQLTNGSTIHVTSKQLRDDIIELMYSLGYLPIVNEENGFKIEYKLQPEFNGIKEIKPLNKKENAVCFLVDNEEHLFQTTKQYIVTHNTETTKALAEALYPGEKVLVNINMPDFKTVEHEPRFRKRLGEIVRHTPNSIVLLDEFEKAAPELLDSLLAILDEGVVNFEVTNREGQVETQQVSLRNTIIVATTNAGHEVFKNFAMFAQNTDGLAIDDRAKDEYEQLRTSLINFLQDAGFKPEMLGRFDRIIPYRGLTENIQVMIAEGIIEKLLTQFKELKGIEFITKPKNRFISEDGYIETIDLAAYIGMYKAKSDDPNSGGARNIKRQIDRLLKEKMIDAVLDNPGTTRFEIYVARDTKLYDPGESDKKEGIIINALN